MATFRQQLSQLASGSSDRKVWLFVAYDQLSDRIGPLATHDPSDIGIVLVESRWKAERRPYHQHKLALVLANMRHFALEQAARGVAVRYVQSRDGYRIVLHRVATELGRSLVAMRAAERELRVEIEPLVADGHLQLVDHDGWLTTTADFLSSQKREAPPFRMDAFYRHVRRETGLLMDDQGKPLGGKLSHDAANRKRWPGKPPAPLPPSFAPDAVTREVIALVQREFAAHPGEIDAEHLPATRADALRLWDWARTSCLPHFGPYEDAMSTRSTGLFHTRVSPLLNLQRLLPRDLVADVVALDIPIASKEGFVRQVLGWREFVRHVHEATDGLRSVENNYLDAHNPLPPAFWGEVASGLSCLDRVVADVWREAYSHHITRLMVLSNVATLIDVDPRALTDWFWVAYADAYDWVVEPNVLGMGTFSAAELLTTKPYVSGAAYIDKMSDYCAGCRFDPKRDCPITSLYWAFLDRHREALKDNPRLRLPLAALDRRCQKSRDADRATFERIVAELGAGRALSSSG